MRIGIDCQSIIGNKTGIGYYTYNLVNQLKKYKNLKLFFYNNEKSDLKVHDRLYWENVDLVWQSYKDKLDIMHVVGFSGPLIKAGYKKITTVHDLIGMIFPENLGFMSRFYWKTWLPFCVKNSDIIISNSEHTKKDIVKYLGVDEKKINVTYLGANENFVKIDDKNILENVHKKYNLPEEFILYVGTIEPRKNISFLVEAFHEYIKSGSSKLKLVITGKKGWAYESLLKKIDELSLSNDVIFTDYIEDSDLVCVYNSCKFFCFPSLYEGFGLPVLEAMSCGKAVISSNSSSLSEIASDSAYLFDPYDKSELVKAIKILDTNKEIRIGFEIKSLKRAEYFNWSKTAKKTYDIYTNIINDKF